MDKTFSIILTVWNRQEIIKRAIRSILNQTYGNFELIVVNDGSSDKTLENINSFTDERIKVISLKQNSGRIVARNRGMLVAKNDWICWLDSDDEYLSIYLEVMNNAINEFPDYKVFNFGAIILWRNKVSWTETFQYNGMTYRPVFKPNEAEVGHEHFESGHIGAGSFIFHRECVKGVGLLPEMPSPYELAEVSGIPSYGRLVRPLGNPWGDDYYMFYKLTRKFKSKPLDMNLYCQHIRREND